MTTNWTFLTSRSLAGLAEPRIDGTPLYDRYAELRDLVAGSVGDDVADFFARPQVTRGNGSAPTSVAWYGPHSGAALRWRDLDDDSRTRVAGTVGGLISRLKPLLDPPGDGRLVARCLMLPALADDLLVVEGQPILTNWGLVPEEAVDSPAERLRLHEKGLGRFAPWLPPPPFRDEDVLVVGGPADPVPEPAFAPGSTAQRPQPAAASQDQPAPIRQASTGAAPAGAVAPVILEERRCNWLPVAIAAGLALLLLLLLLVPGVLLYPPPSAPALSAALVAESEAALRQRIDALRAALGADVCTAVPGGLPAEIEGLLPPAPGRTLAPRIGPPATTDVAGGPGESGSPPSSAPDASPVTVPPSPRQILSPGGPGDASLVDRLDRAAVLVVAPDPRRPGTAATGTGFFVNAVDVVTNLHVVEDADPAAIHVVNTALGRPLTGRLVARSSGGGAEIGRADFAVVRLGEAPAHDTLPLTPEIRRLGNVMAYGYPAVVMETDATYACLLAGDPACVPVGSVTTGIVSALQTGEGGLGLAVHTAAIASGNSGGPLVDYCGRVAGINTFLRRDDDVGLALNFAQTSSSLSAFLAANDIAFEESTGACSLVTAEAPPTAAEPGEAPSPATP